MRSDEPPQKLKTRDRALFVVVALYVVLLAVFLVWFPKISIVKYVVSLLGVFLAAANAELAEKRYMWPRVLLVGVPAIGIMLVQLAGDRENAQTLGSLSEETVRAAQARTQDEEMRSRDFLVQGARDTLNNVTNADIGALIRADRLAVKALLAESQVLSQHRELRDEMLSFGIDTERRLEGYKHLVVVQHAAELQGVIDALEAEVRYRRFAVRFSTGAQGDYFLNGVKGAYKALLDQDDKSKLSQRELCQGMSMIDKSLHELLQQYPISVVYNQLGNIAMACGLPNEALSDFYTGLSLDPTDVLLQESLGYALWIINRDSYGALIAASAAMKTIQPEPLAARRELAEAFRLYDEIKKEDPAVSPSINSRIAELHYRFRLFENQWGQFAQSMSDRILNQYAYFSALQVTNGPRARQLMRSLYERDEKTRADPEYQDTWGFVLMRFYKSEDDLDEAERLFNLATNGLKREKTTDPLVSMHLRELQQFRRDLASHSP